MIATVSFFITRIRMPFAQWIVRELLDATAKFIAINVWRPEKAFVLTNAVLNNLYKGLDFKRIRT